jgi:hypothetical protein
LEHELSAARGFNAGDLQSFGRPIVSKIDADLNGKQLQAPILATVSRPSRTAALVPLTRSPPCGDHLVFHAGVATFFDAAFCPEWQSKPRTDVSKHRCLPEHGHPKYIQS